MIRQATPQDASRLAELLIFTKRCAYRPIFQNDIVSFNEMSVLDLALSYRDDPDSLKGIYVYDDGIIRGMMHISRVNHADGTLSLWLEEFYVDSFFHGQGYGSLLMKDFLSKAKALQVKSAFLWVLEKNIHARRFYESFGFSLTEDRKPEPETPEYLLKYKMLF